MQSFRGGCEGWFGIVIGPLEGFLSMFLSGSLYRLSENNSIRLH